MNEEDYELIEKRMNRKIRDNYWVEEEVYDDKENQRENYSRIF